MGGQGINDKSSLSSPVSGEGATVICSDLLVRKTILATVWRQNWGGKGKKLTSVRGRKQ